MSLALLEAPTDRSTRDQRPKARKTKRKSLSVKQEQSLVERIRKGDRKALDRLVLTNLGLVGKIARSYLRCGLSYEDLCQEGIRGLIRACHDFQPETYGVRFSTYAMYWIRNTIQGGIASGGSTIRIPRHISQMRLKYRRTIGELYSEGVDAIDSRSHQISPENDDEIASRMGISLNKLALIRKTELERTQFHREASATDVIALEETIADSSQSLLDLDNLEELDCLREAIDLLTPIEAWIIRQRFGLDAGSNPDDPSRTPSVDQAKIDPEPKSITWIAQAYGLSTRMIRRCEADAIAKLKVHMKRRFGAED